MQRGVATTSGVEDAPLGRGAIFDVERVLRQIIANVRRILFIACPEPNRAANNSNVASHGPVVKERAFLFDDIG